MTQKLEHREQRIAFEELLAGMRQEDERVERLEKAIPEAVPEWSLVEVVVALQAMRGIDLIAAVTVLAEIGAQQTSRVLIRALGRNALRELAALTGPARLRRKIMVFKFILLHGGWFDLASAAHLAAAASKASEGIDRH
jgi:hypothetical protein